MVTIGEQQAREIQAITEFTNVPGSFGEMRLGYGEVNPLNEAITTAIISDDAKQVSGLFQ